MLVHVKLATIMPELCYAIVKMVLPHFCAVTSIQSGYNGIAR